MFYSQHWVTETTLLTPLPVSFFRLSFVSRTFWLRNHMKFFIFNGIFNFHKYLLKNLAWPFSKSRYIDLTVKIPSKVSFHMNISLPWVSSTVISLWHKCNQLFHLPPVKTLLKEIFKGVCDKTVSTRTSSVEQCYIMTGIEPIMVCRLTRCLPKSDVHSRWIKHC